MIDEVIAVLMPFVFAAIIQLITRAVPSYARRVLRATLSDEMRGVSKKAEDFAVELSTQIYSQLAFLFGILSSGIGCIAFTIRSERPIFAAIGAIGLFSLAAYWFIAWQDLSAKELASSKGKPMRVWKWVAIIVLGLITLYARFFPHFKTLTPTLPPNPSQSSRP